MSIYTLNFFIGTYMYQKNNIYGSVLPVFSEFPGIELMHTL